MASITIKDIPEELHRRLKAQAKANRRSLNAEVIAHLEAVVYGRLNDDPEALVREARELRERIGGYLTQEMIDEAIDRGRRH